MKKFERVMVRIILVELAIIFFYHAQACLFAFLFG